jgi:hypothetical protein
MSMCMILKQAPTETLDQVLSRPELVDCLWRCPDYKPPAPSAFAKLFHRFVTPREVIVIPSGFDSTGAQCDLDKAWHGVHWLLARNRRDEDDPAAWDVPFPEGFLLSAGEPISGSDAGYGEDRAVTREEVAAFHSFLSELSLDEITSRYDSEALISAEVYPNKWEYPGEDQWLFESYADLVDFIAATAKKSCGVIIGLH